MRREEIPSVGLNIQDLSGKQAGRDAPSTQAANERVCTPKSRSITPNHPALAGKRQRCHASMQLLQDPVPEHTHGWAHNGPWQLRSCPKAPRGCSQTPPAALGLGEPGAGNPAQTRPAVPASGDDLMLFWNRKRLLGRWHLLLVWAEQSRLHFSFTLPASVA